LILLRKEEKEIKRERENGVTVESGTYWRFDKTTQKKAHSPYPQN